MDLSIIIVNWNTKQLLDTCLKSVFKYTKSLAYEVIVADNASIDDSVEMVKLKYPQVILIENNENLGFAKANNIAIKKAKGNNLLLLNSDTELCDNSIKILHDFLNSSDKIGACGGKLLYPDKSIQLSYGNFPTLLRIIWVTISSAFHINKFKKPLGVVPYDISNPIQVDYIVGADIMIKRKVLDDVGLLDESFFAYFEETDLCFRIKKTGYEVWYVPQSEIIHVYGGSFGQFSVKKFEVFTKSQLLYYKKNLGYYKPLKCYFLIKFLANMIICSFSNKEKFNEFKKMYSIMKNTSV